MLPRAAFALYGPALSGSSAAPGTSCEGSLAEPCQDMPAGSPEASSMSTVTKKDWGEQNMHWLAESKILSGLKAMGLVKGDVEEMVQQRIGALFMPHGEKSRLDSSVIVHG